MRKLAWRAKLGIGSTAAQSCSRNYANKIKVNKATDHRADSKVSKVNSRADKLVKINEGSPNNENKV